MSQDILPKNHDKHHIQLKTTGFKAIIGRAEHDENIGKKDGCQLIEDLYVVHEFTVKRSAHKQVGNLHRRGRQQYPNLHEQVLSCVDGHHSECKAPD